MRGNRIQRWRLLTSGFSNAFENMAIDEAILGSCNRGKSPPTIRFYGWNPHAVSLGYSQQIKDTLNLKMCESLGIDIVRRSTGGRTVLHDQELTYSLISPSDNPLFSPDILGTYKKISSCLLEGFSALNIKAQLILSKERRPDMYQSNFNPSCFSAPSLYEITVAGKKICGSAQRRGKNAFLQHGSILWKFDALKLSEALIFNGINKKELLDFLKKRVTSVSEQLCNNIGFLKIQEAFIMGFERGLQVELKKGHLSDEEKELKERYLREQYFNPD